VDACSSPSLPLTPLWSGYNLTGCDPCWCTGGPGMSGGRRLVVSLVLLGLFPPSCVRSYCPGMRPLRALLHRALDSRALARRAPRWVMSAEPSRGMNAGSVSHSGGER
jgi:hypothetical protein